MKILIFLYSYILLGIYFIYSKTDPPLIYLLCLIFASFKVVFNYRICSVAYLECKARNIKRDDSYVNQFLNPIVDVRYTNHVYILTILSFVIITYYMIVMEKYKELYTELHNIFKRMIFKK